MTSTAIDGFTVTMRARPQPRLTSKTIIAEGQQFHISSGYDRDGGMRRQTLLCAMKPIDLTAELTAIVRDKALVEAAFRNHWKTDPDTHRFVYYRDKVIPELLIQRLIASGQAEPVVLRKLPCFHVDEHYEMD